jgi:hypothetical protein
MTATDAVRTSGSRPELISVTYRRMRRMGFDAAEAGNITALKNGFGITSQPWTVRELAHLLFLRESHRVGRWCWDADRRDHRPEGQVPTGDQAPALTARKGSVPDIQRRRTLIRPAKT